MYIVDTSISEQKSETLELYKTPFSPKNLGRINNAGIKNNPFLLIEIKLQPLVFLLPKSTSKPMSEIPRIA